jgi:hypothetical protein
MNPRRTLPALAFAFIASAAALPASAAPAVPNLKGSYFGSFVTGGGNPLPSDLNITLQVKQLVSGNFDIGGALRDVVFTGKLKPNGRFTLTGSYGQNDNRIRIKLTGLADPGSPNDLAILQGTYTVSGAWKEKGTFSLNGRSNTPF